MGILEGKVIAITGAGRGIGPEIALLAAQEGASVLVNDLGVAQDGGGQDGRPATAVADEIVKTGGRALANCADISNPAEAASIVEDPHRAFGRIPAETEADRARVERLKSMSADKIAPLGVGLLSDAATGTTNQVFCVWTKEIFLFSAPRPIRSMHRSEGWTPERITSDLFPAFRSTMPKLQRTSEIFSWDPI
jgi:NAD(P)-dependent dehydrogenase (short-subunit alcohol dehydrogenase family)